MPAKQTLTLPPDWDIGPGAAVPADNQVGSVNRWGDEFCDGTTEFFGASIVNKSPAGSEKAHWTAVITGALVFEFSITGDTKNPKVKSIN